MLGPSLHMKKKWEYPLGVHAYACFYQICLNMSFSLLSIHVHVCLSVCLCMNIHVPACICVSWWGRESWFLCLICLPGVLWWLSGSSSRCNGVVCSLWLWYFLIILTYYFCVRACMCVYVCVNVHMYWSHVLILYSGCRAWTPTPPCDKKS